MKHRHLDYSADLAAEALPSAAIVDLLERGDLLAWRPIAASIAADPHGPFAARVAHLLKAYPLYGTSPLFRTFIEGCRARAPKEGRGGEDSMDLAELRRSRGLTQVELARAMGISQSDLSKLERRKDVRVSTLRASARAMGGRLRITFVLPEGEIDIAIGQIGAPMQTGTIPDTPDPGHG